MGLIVDYTPPTSADEYTEDIEELVSAGPGAGWELSVQVSELDEAAAEKKVASEKTKFQTAARNAGYSARQRERDESVEGVVTLMFTLGDRVTRTRKADEDTPLEGVEGDAVAEKVSAKA